MESFGNRFASLAKQAGISRRLEIISIENFREQNKDGFETLNQLTKRITELAPLTRMMDFNDKAKECFLTEEVARTR